MTEQAILKSPVTALPVSPEAKSALLSLLWGPNLPSREIQSGAINTDPYFEYYSQQCDIFSVEQSTYAIPVDETWPEITTHKDLITVAQHLATKAHDRDSVVDYFQEKVEAGSYIGDVKDRDQIINNSVDWAARVLTMMEIGRPKCSFSAQKPLLWETASLQEFVRDHFTPGRRDVGHVRLQKIFTARNLERLARIQIEWTNNLIDHLALRDDDTKVLIFHHATFLEHSRSGVFPPGFCAETLRTLALLLPSSEKKTKKWFRRHQATQTLDKMAIKCARLRADDRQIDNFHFWKDRLVILKQVFDEAEPSTISQWWYDRRKGPQWYTFWVAMAVLLLTVVFGVVQSVEGALQVYKAYHPEGPT